MILGPIRALTLLVRRLVARSASGCVKWASAWGERTRPGPLPLVGRPGHDLPRVASGGVVDDVAVYLGIEYASAANLANSLVVTQDCVVGVAAEAASFTERSDSLSLLRLVVLRRSDRPRSPERGAILSSACRRPRSRRGSQRGLRGCSLDLNSASSHRGRSRRLASHPPVPVGGIACCQALPALDRLNSS